MSIFDGIENVAAEGTSNRQYFAEGQYKVTIDRVFLYERRLGRGKLFVVETTVNESDNPNIEPGEKRNWTQSFANEYTLPRIKSFIGAAIGLCPKKQLKEINERVNKTICEGTVGVDNPLRGRQLKLTCTAKTTSEGKEFMQHAWGQI